MNERYTLFAGKPKYKGVLFDPPYSYRQITEHYQSLKLKASQQDTQSYFYSRVMNKICDKIVPGGYAITCGWHSNGFGERRGFKIIEILLIAHGSHHNDTIVTIEQKIATKYEALLEAMQSESLLVGTKAGD